MERRRRDRIALGQVAAAGAASGVVWRRLPRLSREQLEERIGGEEREGGEQRERERVALHVRLEGRLVPRSSPAPTSSPVARLDRAHAAVIDGFFSERTRRELLSLVVFGDEEEGDVDEGGEGDVDVGDFGGGGRQGKGRTSPRRYDELSGSEGLPRPRWELGVADSAEALDEDGSDRGAGGEEGEDERRRRRRESRLGWGLSSSALDRLLSVASSDSPPRCLAEVGSKICAMFAEDFDAFWLPTESMTRVATEAEGGGKRRRSSDDGDDDVDGSGRAPLPSSYSPPLLVNAASPTDAFSYHVDCDPDSSVAPGSPWHRAYGHYVNGEASKPLLVSVVLYLNESWSGLDLGGETLLVDSSTGVGCSVSPRPGRALLMESDVVHRVQPPRNRLRFSLVWKLALCPKKKDEDKNVVLSREWWGPPSDVGSAKALSDLVRRVGEDRKKGEEEEARRKGG